VARHAHQQRHEVASCHAQARYVPRTTQDRDALALVREHWPAFCGRLKERAGSLPGFVRNELEAFITCGDFEHGFLVAQCSRCGDSLRVPFACKSRGICPSCMGRRMAETAALLVEYRLPDVPWRQWVLSFEGPMAVRLGYDRRLLAARAGVPAVCEASDADAKAAEQAGAWLAQQRPTDRTAGTRRSRWPRSKRFRLRHRLAREYPQPRNAGVSGSR
jgi:hypothetical protein